jgi:hypothetical protein
VFSFDGEEWTLQYEEPTPAMAVADDGTVWIGWGGDHSDDPAAAVGAWLARWDGASFERVGPNPEAPPGGHSGPDGGYPGASTAMAVLPGNQVWVTGGGGWIPVTMRYDGTSGETEFDTTGMSAFAVAPNGDLWGYQGGWGMWHDLGRFDGSDWTFFGADQIVRDGSSLAVGPDGLVWVTSWDSLYSFDGARWTLRLEQQFPYLIRLVDVAPDGTVWYVDKEGVHVLSP